jgi:hypothetical protein
MRPGAKAPYYGQDVLQATPLAFGPRSSRVFILSKRVPVRNRQCSGHKRPDRGLPRDEGS